jgi:hypothetical protein
MLPSIPVHSQPFGVQNVNVFFPSGWGSRVSKEFPRQVYCPCILIPSKKFALNGVDNRSEILIIVGPI